MTITKDSTHLIVKIPLFQEWFDAGDQSMGMVGNINGLIAGDEIGFAALIALGYKQDIQQGDLIVKWHRGKEEFKELCKELNMECHEYPVCAYCNQPIYGAFSLDEKGDKCYSCKLKQR